MRRRGRAGGGSGGGERDGTRSALYPGDPSDYQEMRSDRTNQYDIWVWYCIVKWFNWIRNRQAGSLDVSASRGM